MIKSKRSQGELITTVLIILVVLAAVAVVATFIIRNVRTATGTAEQKQNCLKVELDITRAVAGEESITVKRLGTGDIVLKNITVAVDGSVAGSLGNIESGATDNIDVAALESGQKVEVAAILEDGFACPVAAEITVA